MITGGPDPSVEGAVGGLHDGHFIICGGGKGDDSNNASNVEPTQVRRAESSERLRAIDFKG